ncbi:hypothetical protein SLS57_012156 [Botryosphaeria dothidea]
MRFFAVATLFAIGAVASTETVQIKDATIRDNGDIQSASFTIQPANVKCESTKAADFTADSAILCGDSAYRFELKDGSNGKYALTIHKQTGVAVGLSGTTEFGVVAHAGGAGANDMVVQPAGDVSVTIKSS